MFDFSRQWKGLCPVIALLVAAGDGAMAGAGDSGRGFFRPDDVLALAGGEEMVVMGETPAIELLLLRQPGLATVRVRNLACEGDTVFEQFRQLNFPGWEDQLKRCGATVVVASFGKMESLAGLESVPAFVAAYEKLLALFASGGRRVVIVSPSAFGRPRVPEGAPWLDVPDLTERNESLEAFVGATRELAARRGHPFVDWFAATRAAADSRDGVHAGPEGLRGLAGALAARFQLDPARPLPAELPGMVSAKNRLWFNYWRPQNWAFLHGDRTEQLFGRDHRDTSVRQLVIEIEQYLPLIREREAAIARLAATVP